MKYSTKLSDAAHILVLIAMHPDEKMSSTVIAESIRTNPGYVRQLMGKLRTGGLLHSVRGHAMPQLGVPAEQMTLLDIYKAVEGSKPLLHLDTHTNPECGTGVNIQLALQDYYNEVQSAAEEEMRGITLAEIIETCRERIARCSVPAGNG
ncbi:MAG: Rrf2 family transcriptional regulator [Clostridia bacterium]|nr:Rrf2 family transcriptional regulator [Clostridia bacterium]